jgi:tetratricopeptide (TPR) repeat protein
MRTHEYWDKDPKQTAYTGEIGEGKITTLRIHDLEDGGCKTNKHERDERLLREDIADPENDDFLKTRAKFYLAQTLSGLQKYEESIEWYNKRIQDKGWEEEVFYSKFQIGACYENLGWKKKDAIKILEDRQRSSGNDREPSSQSKLEKDDKDKKESDAEFLKKWNPNSLNIEELTRASVKDFADAATSYKEAYEYRPSRAESLYALTKMFRVIGGLEFQTKAYELALKGREIKLSNDKLFVEPDCYDYLFDWEISIVAYYVDGAKETGIQSLTMLLDRDDLPDWISSNVKSNCKHYL